MRSHDLKTWPEYFILILSGVKTAEMRFNDRSFKPGELIFLREFVYNGAGGHNYYTGRVITVMATHVLIDENFGIKKGYALISFKFLGFTDAGNL